MKLHAEDEAPKKISYDDSDKIIEEIRSNEKRIRNKIVSTVKAKIKTDVNILEGEPEYDAVLLGEVGRVPNFITAIDLSDFIVRIGDFDLLARPSFTVCVDDDSFGIVSDEDLNIHSKVWMRFILLGQGGEIRKVWSSEDIERFFELIDSIYEEVSTVLQNAYQGCINAALSERLSVSVAHSLSVRSYGASGAAFNSVVRSIGTAPDLIGGRARSWTGTSDLKSHQKHGAYLTRLAAKTFGLKPDRQRSVKEFVKHSRIMDDSQNFSVVAVDDGLNKGVYLSKIGDYSSQFVGIAADPNPAFHEEQSKRDESDGKQVPIVKPTSAPSHVTANILSIDIASGF